MKAASLALALLIILSGAFSFAQEAPSPSDDPQSPKPAPAAPSPKIHRDFFSWNPLDLAFTGRLTIGYEHIFRMGGKTYGVFAQYTSPMNSILGGIITAGHNPVELAREYVFPSGIDLYMCFYGSATPRKMRYYPRFGVSVLRAEGEKELGTYISFGPCGRVTFGKNGHAMIALTTLKLKLTGNRRYSIFLLPVFDLMVGFNF